MYFKLALKKQESGVLKAVNGRENEFFSVMISLKETVVNLKSFLQNALVYSQKLTGFLSRYLNHLLQDSFVTNTIRDLSENLIIFGSRSAKA